MATRIDMEFSQFNSSPASLIFSTRCSNLVLSFNLSKILSSKRQEIARLAEICLEINEAAA